MEFYVDFDVDSQCWCIFDDTGFAYASYATEIEAEINLKNYLS